MVWASLYLKYKIFGFGGVFKKRLSELVNASLPTRGRLLVLLSPLTILSYTYSAAHIVILSSAAVAAFHVTGVAKSHKFTLSRYIQQKSSASSSVSANSRKNKWAFYCKFISRCVGWQITYHAHCECSHRQMIALSKQTQKKRRSQEYAARAIHFLQLSHNDWLTVTLFADAIYAFAFYLARAHTISY